MKAKPLCLLGIVILAALPVEAQEGSPPAHDSAPNAAAAPGITFTPAMARALALSLTKAPFLIRYELDPKKTDEVVELIARRLMQFAHEMDTPDGQALTEHLMTGMVEMRANLLSGAEGYRMPVETGKEIGRLLRPLMPKVREVFADITRDVRPMLSTKKQLQLAGDMVIANSALEYLDGIMERWERGDIGPYENPLDPWWGRIQHSGNAERSESRIKQAAKQWTDYELGRLEPSWREYVEAAKKLYALNESQAATADSVLRECLERAQVIIGEESWGERVRQNRLWWHVVRFDWQCGWDHRDHPLLYLFKSDYEELNGPVEKLGDELKRRVDDIPTDDQRRKAEDRIAKAMAEVGFKPEEE